jgi:preprotein translocase subunit SecY
VQQAVRLIRQLFSHPQLRRKILFTAFVFAIFRLLAHIPLPGVDVVQLQNLFAGNQFLSLLNVFSGGTLANFSVMAVGINPYITASIVMQLATFAFPKLKEIQKDGEAGRDRINQYTRLIAVPLAVVQSVSVLALLRSQNLLLVSSPLSVIALVTTLVAGAMILLWIGELVTQYGIGNGISMILFAGIVSQFPATVAQMIATVNSQQWATIATFSVVFLAVIALIVFMNEAIRKVQIQYAKRARGSQMYGGQTTHLPIRVNVTGV